MPSPITNMVISDTGPEANFGEDQVLGKQRGTRMPGPERRGRGLP